MATDTESDRKVDPVLHLGISLAVGQLGMYFPINHLEKDANIDDEVFNLLIKTIQDHPLRVFQHAGYDIVEVFEDMGFPLNGRFVDIMIVAHMVNENIMNKSLDSLHKLFTGGIGKTMPDLMKDIIKNMGWRYVPVVLMNEYATQDAIATSETFTALKPLYEREFGPFYEDL